MKHLDFDFHLVRDQGDGGSNPLSPIALPPDSKGHSGTLQIVGLLTFSVRSVQLRTV